MCVCQSVMCVASPILVDAWSMAVCNGSVTKVYLTSRGPSEIVRAVYPVFYMQGFRGAYSKVIMSPFSVGKPSIVVSCTHVCTYTL